MDSKIVLTSYQEQALLKLKSGSILCGDTGSGKTFCSIFFYLKNYKDKDLYIITTAKNRDTNSFQDSCIKLGVKKFIVDSWNNIDKYINKEKTFFIFDEQRAIGYGKWAKSFIKICKNNKFILLSATPGDIWEHYIPIFIANGFYRNKTDFINQHIEYDPYSKFPKVKSYKNEIKLNLLKRQILVPMFPDFCFNKTYIDVKCDYNKDLYKLVKKDLWNIYESKPIKNAAEYMYILRRVVSESQSRLNNIIKLINDNNKLIIFYNYNFELSILTMILDEMEVPYSQYNGHVHQECPSGERWVYLNNYSASSEAWNCVTTNVIVFYSLNYAYRVMKQAEGRIARMNTTYKKLYYYYLISDSSVDKGIKKSLANKKNFNIKNFSEKEGYHVREQI